jgi:lysophospholipase L1-like esterase
MKTSVEKIVFTGDFIVDRTWTDEWRTENWTHWTDIVSHDIEAICINTATNQGTIDKMSNNVNKNVMQYNPTHIIFNGGAMDLYTKVLDVDTIVSAVEFMTIVFYESNVKYAYLFVPIDASAYDSTTNQRFLELRTKLKNMFNKYGKWEDVFIDMNGGELGTVGSLKRKMYIDGINLSEEGQMAVAKRISQYIYEKFSEEDSIAETPLPSGQIICKKDENPLYIKIGNSYKPLVIGDTNNTMQAVCKIKWRS